MKSSDNPLYSDIITAWMNEHKLRIMESTAYNYFRALPYVQQYFKGVRIKDVTSNSIYKYVIFLKHSDLTITSTRLYCKVIQMSLNYAVKYHYIYYIHFDQHFISVQRAISRANSKSILKSTKTAAGVRRIDIDTKLIAYLREMQAKTEGDFVFAGTQKGHYAYRIPWNISRLLKDMCKRAGIPPRNFYALRHTHATILLAHGVHPKIVQERLGHSDINVTMEVYSHMTPTIQREAVNVMEDIF